MARTGTPTHMLLLHLLPQAGPWRLFMACAFSWRQAPPSDTRHATPGIRGFPLFMGRLCPWATLTPGRFGLQGAYVGLTVH